MIDIKAKLDEYLEFDSNKMFFDPLVRVFGGAIRDIIAEETIHDIDIIVGSKSIGQLEFFLSLHGYKHMESLIPKDIASIYHDLKIISEPHTWIKGTKIVQLIRPSVGVKHLKNDIKVQEAEIYAGVFQFLIENVDISCCGVSYDGESVYENYPNAILHCLNKVFITNHSAAMYNDKRIDHRKAKLESRGWVKMDKMDIRDIKIESILKDNISLNFIPYETCKLQQSESLIKLFQY